MTATGGIGGVHPGGRRTSSADLWSWPAPRACWSASGPESIVDPVADLGEARGARRAPGGIRGRPAPPSSRARRPSTWSTASRRRRPLPPCCGPGTELGPARPSSCATPSATMQPWTQPRWWPPQPRPRRKPTTPACTERREPRSCWQPSPNSRAAGALRPTWPSLRTMLGWRGSWRRLGRARRAAARASAARRRRARAPAPVGRRRRASSVRPRRRSSSPRVECR